MQRLRKDSDFMSVQNCNKVLTFNIRSDKYKKQFKFCIYFI